MASYQYIESTGVIVPDTETLLDEVQQVWRGILGEDMPVDPETPQAT